MRPDKFVQRPASSYISRGVTLIELVLTIVIISLALVASLTSLSTISGRSSDVLLQSRAIDLGQIYLDEILSKNFDEATGPGGVPTYIGTCRATNDGENRENYDDVDDFNGLNEVPTSLTGSHSGIYTGFNVSVVVACDNTVGAGTDGTKRVTVSVTDPNGNTIPFTAYKGNY